MTNQYI